MSTTKDKKSDCGTASPRVLARGALDRPYPVYVLGVRGTVAQVRGEGATGASSFPAGELYAFDGDLYGRLCAAHAAHDARAVMRLWAEARPLSRR